MNADTSSAAPSAPPIGHPIITRTALIKAAIHCKRLALLSMDEGLKWIRGAIAAGVEIEKSKLHSDIDARCIVLPDTDVTDMGDRLVAVCVLDQHGSGDLVLVTVKPLRSMLKTEEYVAHRAPPPRHERDRARVPAATVDLHEPPPPPSRIVKLPPIRLAPALPVAPVDSPPPRVRCETEGAQLARVAAARRGLDVRALAAEASMPVRSLSMVFAGKIPPTLREAVALRDLLGVPIDAWLVEPRTIARTTTPTKAAATTTPRQRTRRRDAGLPPKPDVLASIREIATLRRGGWSNTEIATHLGIPVGTVSSRAWRAKSLGLRIDAGAESEA